MLTMILLALLLFEDLICWNDRYIQLYLLAVSIDIYQVEYQISRTDMVSHITQLPQQHIAVSIKYCPGGHFQGWIRNFKLGGGGGGAHLKKLRRAEGGAKIFGVFRVKNRDFTPKNHIFSNFKWGRAFYRQMHALQFMSAAPRILHAFPF